jgi:hypothetical protein
MTQQRFRPGQIRTGVSGQVLRASDDTTPKTEWSDDSGFILIQIKAGEATEFRIGFPFKAECSVVHNPNTGTVEKFTGTAWSALGTHTLNASTTLRLKGTCTVDTVITLKVVRK